MTGDKFNRLETAQEQFWKGEFGDAYIERNTANPQSIATNIAFFSRIFSRTGQIKTAVELGANVGLNLRALASINAQIKLTAVEINAHAATALRTWGGATVIEGSLLDDHSIKPHELAFTKGVLIHINPECLDAAYDRLVASSNRWILISEYYNPSPVTVDYRGHSERLYKRDFAGDLLDRYRSLVLVDYGFCYRRDPAFPADDMTWFLMEKRG